MVIRDLSIERVTASPLKTDSPLVIDADTVLPCTTAAEFFKSIRGRHAQVIEVDGVVDHS